MYIGWSRSPKEILKRLSKEGKLVGIDQDEEALGAASEKLKEYENVLYKHSNFII